jgi:DNA-binding XRE family transcriptional regulator
MADIPANRLSVLRTRSRLTQQEVAKLLDIDHTTVNAHEAARRGLSDDMLIKYAKIYKVQTHEIFVDPDRINPKARDEQEQGT